MKNSLFSWIIVISVLTFLFVNCSGNAEVAEESLSKSVNKQTGRDSSDREEAEIKSQNENVNQKKCPKCEKLYPSGISFCGADGEKLIELKEIIEETNDPLQGLIDAENLKDKIEEKSGLGAENQKSEEYENFQKAMEYINTGDLLREKRNDYAGALANYKRAENLDPDNLKLHYRLAGAYWKMGDREKALHHLDRCKELFPKGTSGITAIDKYIGTLERGLSVEDLEQRRKIKSKKMEAIMKEALEKNREKWSEMVLVPEGKFLMGSKDDEFSIEEMPQHEVYLSSYYADKYEVTNALYWEFLDYIKRTKDHSKCYFGEGPNKDHAPDQWYEDSYYEHPGWPVVRIDWYDAYAFAAWAGKRLLTEAEWEKAARGTDARRFPWGNVWDTKKCNAGLEGSLEVGSHEGGKSVYGMHDACGSIQEWCNDWHHAMYYKNSPSRDPQGPLESTNLRVIRGSSLFANNVYQMRVTIRWYDESHRRNRSVGFRCAKDFETKEASNN